MQPAKLLVVMIGLFVTLLLVSSVLAAKKTENTQTQASIATATYVGMEQCATCHEDQVKAFKKTIHGQKGFEMRSDKGCETCHGPGSAHVESGGDKTLIRRFETLKGDEASNVCLQCHENGNRTYWKGGVHQQRSVSCTSCHTIHHGQTETLLKTANVIDTCAGCHLQIKAQLQRTSHHPMREGLMTCTSCHNPHGTATPKMITANSVNEQCYTCHTEKRGPFLWEHPPVRENCLNCHMPHGSNHPKLLVAKRPFLCQNCHLDTRHPGTLYDATNILTSNRELSRSCSNCHLMIHGSNHPSGAFFLR
jgi:DmsE family decaheme c-type cytochrome